MYAAASWGGCSLTNIFDTLADNIRGYWDFRSNSLYDFSGETHPMVPNNCYYGESGMALNGDGYLDASNQTAVDATTALSVVA